MIVQTIGKTDNGIDIKIFDDGRISIWELMRAGRIEKVNLNPEEALILKNFLNKNLK